MGAFFTQYGDERDSLLSVSGTIESKHFASGYLLFVSTTYGSWNPYMTGSEVKVRLAVELTTGEVLHASGNIRVTDDAQVAEDFSPNIVAHVADSSTWNHSTNA